MYDSFIDQLSGLDLSGLSIRPAPFNETDFPCEDAIEHTLAAVWSDLFAMFLGKLERPEPRLHLAALPGILHRIRGLLGTAN